LINKLLKIINSRQELC